MISNPPDGTPRQRVIKAGWEGFRSQRPQMDEHSVNGYLGAAREALLIAKGILLDRRYMNDEERIRDVFDILLADLSAPSDDEKVSE